MSGFPTRLGRALRLFTPVVLASALALPLIAPAKDHGKAEGKGTAILRAKTVALLNRVRTALIDEVEAHPKLPRNLEAQVFIKIQRGPDKIRRGFLQVKVGLVKHGHEADEIAREKAREEGLWGEDAEKAVESMRGLYAFDTAADTSQHEIFRAEGIELPEPEELPAPA